MTGFAPELFLEAADDKFICSICFAVFNHPVTCQDGHSFCKECITKWQLNNTRCPVDRSNLRGLLVRNLALEGAIAKRIVKCTSTIARPGGCHWTGPLSSLESHLPCCDMKVVECKFKGRGCILRAYQHELAQHLLTCPYRIVKCSSCTFEIPHSELSAHNELCCPNNCGDANVSLGGFSVAGSWRIDGAVSLAICRPIIEGDAAVVILERSNGNGISVKLNVESKLNMPWFGVDLRCCFQCGVDKLKFNTPR
ncbi:RING finger protein 151-like [Montipora capricornis]|uniref:RING finger protein 151-like n=1 Tax=Montipora capricornis TaxID=246305 RepID=UPI0035F150D0